MTCAVFNVVDRGAPIVAEDTAPRVLQRQRSRIRADAGCADVTTVRPGFDGFLPRLGRANECFHMSSRWALIVLLYPTAAFVELLIQLLFLKVGQQGNQPTQSFIRRQALLSDRAARKLAVGIVIVVEGEDYLLQIVLTLRTRSGLPNPSHPRQKKADADDKQQPHHADTDPDTHGCPPSFALLINNSTTDDRGLHSRIGDAIALRLGQDIAR